MKTAMRNTGAGATGTINAHVAAAVAWVAKGDVASGIAAWRGIPESARDPAAHRARQFFSEVEGRGLIQPLGEGPLPALEAAGSHEPHEQPAPPAVEPRSSAWALAWAGDVRGARRLAEAGTAGPDTTTLLGVLALLEGHPRRAIPLLEAGEASGGDGNERLLHLARAFGQVGSLRKATAALSAVRGDGFAARVVSALIAARDAPAPWGRFAKRVKDSESHFNGLFSSELRAIFGPAEIDRAFASRASLVGLLEALLDRLAGNLGASPTTAEILPGGARRFVRLALPATPRAEAVEALSQLSRRGAQAAEAAFADLLARRPRSAQAYAHRGELRLWLGRYDDALEDFIAARRLESIRWADVGIVAARLFKGQLALAHVAALSSGHHFTPTRGGTLPVYRGVLYRRRGDMPRAIADLGEAVDAKPTRIGARMELCLALRASGRTGEAATEAQAILRDGAPLLIDVAEARGLPWIRERGLLTGDEVLEEALLAMRGNRSSGIVTWFDRTGSLRLLARADRLEGQARRVLGGGR